MMMRRSNTFLVPVPNDWRRCRISLRYQLRPVCNDTLMLLRSSASIAVLFALLAACRAPPDDTAFRDLNKNGKLDVYEDVMQAVDARINDLLSQMSVAEKAGLMFINISIVNDDATLEFIPGSGPERWAPCTFPDTRARQPFMTMTAG